MHELSLSSAIVATVTKHAGGLPVSTVKLRVGVLRQVVPDSLEFYFDLVARDTICEGARLEQELVPGRMRCACSYEWNLDAPSFRCPLCGAGDAKVVSGEEFEVESIMVEEETSDRLDDREHYPATSHARRRKSEANQEVGVTEGKQRRASSSAGA